MLYNRIPTRPSIFCILMDNPDPVPSFHSLKAARIGAMKDGITSFVCVRRVNSSWFNSDMITTRCKKQIDAFRSMNLQQGLIFELWVRGYARAFYRYRVLPDTIEETGIVPEPEIRAGKKALQDAMTTPAQTERTDEKFVGDTSLTIG